MRGRLRRHLRSNLIAYIALFVAMSGTAYSVDGSLAGRNTVGSADIMKGEVKSSDVGTNQIRSTDVRDAGLGGGGLSGVDISDDGLTGLDIFEQSLGTVPNATRARSADNGGSGRYAFEGSCDPETSVFVDCATLIPVTLPVAGRVLVIATVQADLEMDFDSDIDEWKGECRLEINGTPQPASRIYFESEGRDADQTTHGTLMAVTGVLQAGNHGFAVECNDLGSMTYSKARMTTVTLSNN